MQIIHPKGIYDNVRINSLLFYNDKIGFCVGDLDDLSIEDFNSENLNDFDDIKREALIFSTDNGGKEWNSQRFGEGSFIKVSMIKDTLFAFKVSDSTNYTTIYKSDNLGKNWYISSIYPGIINDIILFKEKKLFVCKQEKFSFCTYEGSEFRTYQNLNKLPVIDYVVANQHLYFTTNNSKEVGVPNAIVKYDGEKIELIELPNKFKCYLVGYNGSNVELIGIQDNNITIYEILNDTIVHNYSYTKENNLFPKGYFSNGVNTLIIVGKKNSFGVENKILIERNGKDWYTQKFLHDFYIDPFFFISDNDTIKAWFYSGDFGIQVFYFY